jgi:branched-chain amino acid transport system substrate-binding protein
VVGESAAGRLRPLLDERGVPFVAAGAGANVPRDAERGPGLYRCSLAAWEGSWALGAWAAAHLGRRAFVAASLRESGYDALYAFRHAFELAGGAIVGTAVTGLAPGDHDLTTLMAQIRQARPEVVHALYGGGDAVAFVRAYARSGLASRVPLTGGPLLADESRLAAMGTAAPGIRTALSWAAGLPGETPAAFRDAYRAATGREAGAWAALGHDAGRLVRLAVEAAHGAPEPAAALREALDAARFEGARGALRMDAAAGVLRAPVHLRQVRADGDALVNAALGELPVATEGDRRLASLLAAPHTGWLNAYGVA